MVTEAPPRSRRSTPISQGMNHMDCGSSALAEIDPRRPPRRGCADRLLRARGDRPARALRSVASAPAPPRSRRSTQSHDVRRALHHGSSALAEIDPPPPSCGPRRPWLLRARGDRPTIDALWRCVAWAPPRSRRSTRPRGDRAAPVEGSSALAEIDPRAVPRSCSGTRLLRARGDRPVGKTTACELLLAPPRSRRSTRTMTMHEEQTNGSSALAEIDPRRAPRTTPLPRLLRARGDRPAPCCRCRGSSRAPPRSRRSTRRAGLSLLGRGGSSALAEIDPPPVINPGPPGGLLRARGDRPAGGNRGATP